MREVVRRVNDWRRAAGFNVEDRITIRYRATPELARALQRFDSTIRQETLARSMEPAGDSESGFFADAQFGGQSLEVWLERVLAA